MVIVAGTVEIKPELVEEAKQLTNKVSAATQAEEGCITYQFYSDLSNPSTFLVFEVWESEAALAAHFKTEHMAEFQPQLPKYLAGKPNIKKYMVSSMSDL